MCLHTLNSAIMIRVGNLILTELAIGQVTLRNAAKTLQFALAQDILTLAWVSGRVLISIPDDSDMPKLVL